MYGLICDEEYYSDAFSDLCLISNSFSKEDITILGLNTPASREYDLYAFEEGTGPIPYSEIKSPIIPIITCGNYWAIVSKKYTPKGYKGILYSSIYPESCAQDLKEYGISFGDFINEDEDSTEGLNAFVYLSIRRAKVIQFVDGESITNKKMKILLKRM